MYSEFNRYIYDYFFRPENVGQSIIFSVDESLINSFCYEVNATPQDLQTAMQKKFQLGWYFALKAENSIPQFFGLLAVQVFVAHLMHKDEQYSASAYNPRLWSYLNITQQTLQKYYAEFQDNLWMSLKKFGLKKDIEIVIPTANEGSWRYVQYPVSQALLNQEDLKSLPYLFQHIGLKPNESISIDDFKNLINGSDGISKLPRHYHVVKKKLTLLEKEDSIIFQIYDCYGKWDGTFGSDVVEGTKSESNSHSERHVTYLSIDTDFSFVEVFNRQSDRLAKYLLNDPQLFDKLGAVRPLTSGIMIFEKDHFYNSWTDKRYLERGKSHVIISRDYSVRPLVSKLDKNFVDRSTSYCEIYEVSIESNYNPVGFWRQYFSNSIKPFQFGNGVLLARDTWMVGSGPTIFFTPGTKAWLNGSALNIEESPIYSCRELGVGDYRLKAAGFTPVKFSIMEPENNSPRVAECGWNIDSRTSDWSACSLDYKISGLYFKSEETQELGVRDWIATILYGEKTTVNPSIIIKALQRKNDGHILD